MQLLEQHRSPSQLPRNIESRGVSLLFLHSKSQISTSIPLATILLVAMPFFPYLAHQRTWYASSRAPIRPLIILKQGKTGSSSCCYRGSPFAVPRPAHPSRRRNPQYPRLPHRVECTQSRKQASRHPPCVRQTRPLGPPAHQLPNRNRYPYCGRMAPPLARILILSRARRRQSGRSACWSTGQPQRYSWPRRIRELHWVLPVRRGQDSCGCGDS